MVGKKTFEEQFPSLKGIAGEWIIAHDIQDSCLDKQRVKEVLEKHDEHEDWPCLMQVLKELGL